MIKYFKIIKSKLITFVFLIFTILLHGQTSNFENKFSWKEFPPIPPSFGDTIQHGLAAPFAGTTNGVVIVAGGCNFPNAPVYENGKKKYYNDVFVLTKKDDNIEWKTGFKIEKPTAYGASVSLPNGVLCIGGKNNKTAHNEVFLINWNEKTGEIELENFPSLPLSMSNMGATLIGDEIYIVGGVSNNLPSNKFLKLNLSNKDKENFEWEILPDFPGHPRLQPVVISQNAAEEKHLYVFSGSHYPKDSENPIIATDGLEYNPKTKSWNTLKNIQPKNGKTYSLHGAGATQLGVNHIVFVGGVNKDIFFDAWKKLKLGSELTEDNETYNDFLKWKYEYFTHKPNWYKFNKNVLVFNTITQQWVVADEYPFPAPAGAPIVKWEDGWLVINGETKPGVRSPKVYFGTAKSKPSFGYINWMILAIYLLGMLYLGYFFMKKENNTDDFFKGGGRIPWWAAGISIFATTLSAITFMAIPTKTFSTDWKYFPMAITLLLIAFPVVKYYLPFFRRLSVTTAYEYLEKRFNYTTRFLASGLFITFMIARMALVLFLPSLALTVVTGIDIYLCIILMGIITIIYCTMGGVEAVIWGDVIQGFVLAGGAILALIFIISGIDGGWNRMIEISIEHSKFAIFDKAFDLTKPTIWVVVLGGLANNLISYSSDQTVIQRYLTTKDEKSAGRSIILNGFLGIAALTIFYLIGTALFSYYSQSPELMNFSMANPDSIFPHFIMSKMPVGVSGLLIAAIFSATMSTVSSNINSVSTAFTVDIFQHFFKNHSDKFNLKIARLSGIIAGIIGILIALLMATWNILSLFDYFNYILGLLTSGLGGLFLMGIFFRRIQTTAALVGFTFSSIILLFVKQSTDIHFLLYGFIGMASSVIIALIISYITPQNKNLQKGLTVHDLK